jgi:miniconductance mechanosensitive channel
MEKLANYLSVLLKDLGASPRGSEILSESIIIILILLVAFLGYFLTRWVIIRIVHIIAKRTKSQWDDIMVEKRVFHRLAYLAPALIINYLFSARLESLEFIVNTINLIVSLYIVVVMLQVVMAVLKSVNEIYNTYEISRTKPIKGYIQVIQIIAFILAILAVITIILGSENIGWVAGLGAFSAVLLLVFKDPILGFVGGIQLSANNMVRIGDWIEMPKYGADGTVIDISLTTVKVQNWNKTITTIPTYTLVTDYFKNWRGMEESGGRRIKRSINIDMSSIKFCTPEMLERFRKFQHVSDYVDETEKEIETYNQEFNIDNTVLVNGRRQTNIGVFRAYLRGYLKRNPNFNMDMTFLVRHLQPTDKGLPIEVYVFSKVQSWAEYENIQADIFDHILAVIPEFDLRVFQSPSGADFKAALSNE